MKFSVRILGEIMSRLVRHAVNEPEHECCGLLAGRDGVITRVFPATNVASKPATSYEIAPQEIFHCMREMRSAGLDLLGIYHSHPNGKNEPSPTDIERAYYPDAAYFILSPRADAQNPVRAFSIQDGKVAELEVRVV